MGKLNAAAAELVTACDYIYSDGIVNVGADQACRKIYWCTIAGSRLATYIFQHFPESSMATFGTLQYHHLLFLHLLHPLHPLHSSFSSSSSSSSSSPPSSSSSSTSSSSSSCCHRVSLPSVSSDFYVNNYLRISIAPGPAKETLEQCTDIFKTNYTKSGWLAGG